MKLCTGFLLTALLAGPGLVADPGVGIRAGKSASFDVRHEFVITVPQGASTLRAWLPMPCPNDRFQRVQGWDVEGPFETTEIRDNWGNTFLQIVAEQPVAGDHSIVTTFRIERREVNGDIDATRTRPHTETEKRQLSRWLEDSSMSVCTPDIENMARTAVGSETNPIRAARKLYDTVLDRIENHVKDPKPDAQKSMNATGTGSSEGCFNSGTGNCTDFHSLYAAASRSVGIPTRVVYGSLFKGPLNGVDQDQSFHCWIEFHAPNVGWIPLDVAVADIFVADFSANEHSRPRADLTVANGYQGPDPALVDYYFGNLDSRRVTWHWGRDLVLGQKGGPLWWNPKGYAEADGSPTQVARKLTFVEVTEPDAPAMAAQPSRRFHVRYVTSIRPSERGDTMRLWIPVPTDDPHQRIRDLKVASPFPYELTREPKHGNRMVFIEAPAPKFAAAIVVEYDVDRYPYKTDLDAFGADGVGYVEAMYGEPSRLCVINDDIRARAEALSNGSPGTLARARMFYDYVASEMTYGKPKELPWGRGDTVYACRAGIGNCTDFHSYFISLCRSKGIASRFQIGLYGKYESHPGNEYKTGGYHCWAEFYVPGRGWVPVDISEADKDPKRMDEFFGGHTDNRVTVTTGRDLVLAPAQSGEPLNYFIHPYAEIDGVPYDGAAKEVYWQDLE